MKSLKRIFLFFLSVYLVLCGVLFFIQERIIFNPYKLSEDFTFRMGEEVEIGVDEGVFLNCLLVKEEASKGVILYLHGNRGSIRRCIRQAENMMGNGYDVFIPDYRGYGKSDGEIESEEQLQSDIQKVYDYLKSQYDENEIVVLGYSIGTGLASYLAAQNNPKKLVMVAPYLSLLDLKDRRVPFIPDFLLRYPMNSQNYLQKVTAPVTLFHGIYDRVIPFESSEKLQAINSEKINLVTVESSHRGVLFEYAFRKGLKEFLR